MFPTSEGYFEYNKLKCYGVINKGINWRIFLVSFVLVSHCTVLLLAYKNDIRLQNFKSFCNKVALKDTFKYPSMSPYPSWNFKISLECRYRIVQCTQIHIVEMPAFLKTLMCLAEDLPHTDHAYNSRRQDYQQYQIPVVWKGVGGGGGGLERKKGIEHQPVTNFVPRITYFYWYLFYFFSHLASVAVFPSCWAKLWVWGSLVEGMAQLSCGCGVA
jgi:hypothetical protein